MSRVVLFGIYKNLLSGANEEKALQVDSSGNLITTSGPGGVAGPTAADIGAATDAALRATPLPVSSPTLAKETGGNLAAVATALNTGTTHADLLALLTALNTGTTHADLLALLTALNTGVPHADSAAILAKLIANPATEATSAALLAALNTGTTHVDLAGLQATLNAILAEQRDDVFIETTLWEDRTTVVSIFYRESRVRSQDDGTVTTIYTRLSDNVIVGSMPVGVMPVSGATDRTIEYYRWKAKNTGTGYTAGDWISNTLVFDTGGAGAVLSSTWYNLSAGAAIASAPPGADLQSPDDLLSNAVGAQSDVAATSDAGAFSLIAFVKRSLQNWTTVLGRLPLALGTGTSAQSLKVVLPSDQVAIPTRLGLTDYVQTTGNNTSAQLAAAATFPGNIESALNYPQILVSVRCDQPYTVTVKQYSDAAGTITFAPDIVYTRETGVSLNQSINVVSSYFQVLVQNTGSSATTNLFLETWLGILPPLPNLTNAGNLPVSRPKTFVRGATSPAIAVVNLLATDSVTPTDVSDVAYGILYVNSANTGRNFQLNGGWDAASVATQNLPLIDMALPLAAPLYGPQPTAASFNRAYKVDLAGVRFVQLTLTAGAASTNARLVAGPGAFSGSAVVALNANSPLPAGSNLIGVTNDQLAAPSVAIADVASSIINTVGTTLSTVITPTWGVSQSFTYTVTGSTGAPSLTANILESLDGINYNPIATLTMTAAGTFSTNLTAIQGRFYRYQEIFAGAASSITRSVSRTQSNEQAPIAGKPTPFTTLNTSGTANTSTTALAANPARKYLFVQNLSASPMFITTGATAANNAGIRLAANGGSQEFAVNGLCPTNAIQIICPAAATQPYTVVEM
jgi:hypothetical protein